MSPSFNKSPVTDNVNDLAQINIQQGSMVEPISDDTPNFSRTMATVLMQLFNTVAFRDPLREPSLFLSSFTALVTPAESLAASQTSKTLFVITVSAITFNQTAFTSVTVFFCSYS